MSGYPNRAESEHDWIENSHASTALSYAHGIASGFALRGIDGERKVVAVVGDGALTGGMAYEALNNLGHSRRRVVIVLNDNGRSYAPTVSQLSQSLTTLRLNPDLHRGPGAPAPAPARAAGARRAGLLERALADQRAARDGGAAHLLRGAGRALRRADRRPRHRAHGAGLHARRRVGRPDRRPRADAEGSRLRPGRGGRDPAPARRQGDQAESRSRTPWAARPAWPSAARPAPTAAASPRRVAARDRGRRVAAARRDLHRRLLAVRCWRRRRRTRASSRSPPPCRGRPGCSPSRPASPTASSTSASPSSTRSPRPPAWPWPGCGPSSRCTRPSGRRAFDQANLDVGLHGCPVVFVLDRAGITGDDGPSHHGILDLALALSIPGMTVFAPSSAEEVEPMLRTALELPGPSTIRVPKTAPRHVSPDEVGSGLEARQLRAGDGSVCLLGVGKMVGACLEAADELAGEGIDATVWDVRVVSPARRGHARRRRAPSARGDGGGRRPPRRCRRLPCRRHGGPGRVVGRSRRPRPGCSGSLASTSPRARPTTSWPASASTAPASPRACAGSGSTSRPSPPPKSISLRVSTRSLRSFGRTCCLQVLTRV